MSLCEHSLTAVTSVSGRESLFFSKNPLIVYSTCDSVCVSVHVCVRV